MAHPEPPSALTHHPLSCLSAGTEPKYQGVVTYTLPVEAFATGIKMESSDQRYFLEPIKGSR